MGIILDLALPAAVTVKGALMHLPKGGHLSPTSILMEGKTTLRNARFRTGCITFTELFWAFAEKKPAEKSCFSFFNSFFLTSLLFQVSFS